jgi:hypothetical protein
LSPNLTMIFEAKKFMWDGRLFDAKEEGLREAEEYTSENFEVRMVEQERKFLVYTRRTPKESAAAKP